MTESRTAVRAHTRAIKPKADPIPDPFAADIAANRKVIEQAHAAIRGGQSIPVIDAIEQAKDLPHSRWWMPWFRRQG